MTRSESAAHDFLREDGPKAVPSRFDAAETFCRAASAAHRMVGSENHREDSEDHLADAAGALITLARLDASEALAVALRPDPYLEESLWTVACYQIGDLIPCALADFNDAAKAVRAIANCDDASHVAAELIASTGTGVRWTALVRVGEQVRFQLASEDSASSGSGAQAGALERAFDHWHERLDRWAEHGGNDALGEPVLTEVGAPSDSDAFGASMTEIVAALEQVQAAISSQAGRFDEITARLGAIERRLSSVVEAIRDLAGPKDDTHADATGRTTVSDTLGR